MRVFPEDVSEFQKFRFLLQWKMRQTVQIFGRKRARIIIDNACLEAGISTFSKN